MESSASLLAFISRLDWGALSVDEIETRLEWWWRGENRALRRAMETVHRTRCERGRGVLVGRVTGQVVKARCKSWRECSYCAWLYGVQVERLFKQVKRLRALVVFTMPPEFGDPFNKEHIAAQARAMRRLSERLVRAFGHRFSTVWTREHNTKRGGPGRLHLNVLWDEEWVEQAWLSETAAACGFGEVVDISRIGAGGRHTVRSGQGQGRSAAGYATKCLHYASKDLSNQADWPKGTRRWGASRLARAQMRRPERNPDWYWSAFEPPTIEVDGLSYIVPEPPSALKLRLNSNPDQKLKPRLYTYDQSLALQRRAWAPRAPDGAIITRSPDGFTCIREDRDAERELFWETRALARNSTE